MKIVSGDSGGGGGVYIEFSSAVGLEGKRRKLKNVKGRLSPGETEMTPLRNLYLCITYILLLTNRYELNANENVYDKKKILFLCYYLFAFVSLHRTMSSTDQAYIKNIYLLVILF